jgi:[acyl-carrier-protein] S-malonyltransferase
MRKQQLAAARAALAASNYQAAYAPAAAAAPATYAGPAAAPGGGGAPKPNVFLFPGQGSQAVGMISPAAAALPEVQRMLEAAQRVLGYDLLEVVQNGEQRAR